jgi:hypothetical protein
LVDKKFETQLSFIIEIDVKNITRKSKLFDGSCFENDAEHSWTICIIELFRNFSFWRTKGSTTTVEKSSHW